MKSSSVYPLIVVAAFAALALNGFAQDAKSKPVKKQTVELKDAKGNSVGTATIKASGKGVKVNLDLKDLSPGEHAVHFHQNAKCDPPDFKSAGPHFNPAQKEHGLQNPKGPHNGDMPNFVVTSNGTAQATVKDPAVVLGTGSE